MSAQLSRCVAVYSRHFVASRINAPTVVVAVVFTLHHCVTTQTTVGRTKSLRDQPDTDCRQCSSHHGCPYGLCNERKVGSGCGVTRRRRYFRYYVLTNQSGPSGQICLTLISNAKVSVNFAILHPLTINCHPVSCIYDGIRQILTLIILGNICKRVANFRHKFMSCSRLLVCVGE